jgi:hypothetical protein
MDYLDLLEAEFANIRIEQITENTIDTMDEHIAQIAIHLEDFTQRYNDCKNRFNTIKQDYESYQRERERQRQRQQPTTLTELMYQITNPHQKDTLLRICPSYSRHEEDQIFMNAFTQNTSTERRLESLAGTFEILGCMKKGQRTHYDVKLYKPNTNPRGSLWCSCSDYKFHSSKQNKVCKHICFVVCKLAKILDLSYFETKQLTQEQFEKIMEKATDMNTLRDCTLCRVPDNVTIELFQHQTKTIDEEDTCPICFDVFQKDIQPLPLSCPACHNYVHKDCMDVWLERKHTCVYCRNDIWKKYKTALHL